MVLILLPTAIIIIIIVILIYPQINKRNMSRYVKWHDMTKP